jgi:enoyl-CoA hydratase/carnithine racemase
MADDNPVLYDLHEGVALLTLNRPERNNAWTYDMEREYFAAIDRADADADVRVVVVTGAGKAFCPGLDMDVLRANAQLGAIPTAERRPQTYALGLRKPLVAAINGACAGIGLVQALVADLRFASTRARITTAYARRGLVAEYNTAWLLPRIMGYERALDLLLSGRVIDGTEAHAMGLVSRLCEPDDVLDAALVWARDTAANCSPMSMVAMKRQVVRAAALPFDAAMRETFDLMQSVADHPDFSEGVASFTEKRVPEFQALPDDYDVTFPADR